MALNPADGSGNWKGSFKIMNNRIVDLKGPPLVVTSAPPRLRHLPVVNRGVRHEPPTTHLGQPIDLADDFAMAVAILTYYREFLTAAEAKFVTAV